MNTDIIQEGTSYDKLDIIIELESEGSDIFAEEDAVDPCSTERRTLSAVSDKNPASDSNSSRLQDGQPDDTQSHQLALAAVSSYQSDFNGHLPKRLRQGTARNDRRKRPRTIALVRLTLTVNTASAAPESADL